MKSNFWSGKNPCWEMHECPVSLRDECPAYIYRFSGYPCWEIEGTLCKLNTKDGTTSFIDRCYNCNVYMKYGKGEPITLKERGTGTEHDKLLQVLTKREEYEWLLKHIGSK